jgi:integrase
VADTKHLERHGRQWRVRVKVPKALREIVGRPHVVRPLHTDSLTEANRLKHRVVAEIKAQFEDARRRAIRGFDPDTIAGEAIRWREALTEAEMREDHEAVNTIREALGDRAMALASQRGAKGDVEDTFASIALGARTPLSLVVERFIEERKAQGQAAKQIAGYHKVAEDFAGWLDGRSLAAIEEVTRRVAGEYVSYLRSGGRRSAATINKAISHLKTVWDFAKARGLHRSDSNPWAGQRVTAGRQEAIPKRPFVSAEVSEVLALCSPATTLGDAVRIALLSGMRASEIARLTARDIITGNDGLPWFDVVVSKTVAGVRRVPIHTGLCEIVERRRASGGRLFPELPEIKEGDQREPGYWFSKQFGRTCRAIVEASKRQGDRQGAVSFHAARRWFITAAINAGALPQLVGEVVGHEQQGETMGTYFGGQIEQMKRTLVEGVRLPSKGA